ncbi:hypothetical protein [Microbacterium aerolatum]|uniref:hypothetical protein n=1 Tax=Microbacterium aerolatum TaxID=153731 RepID=UPI00384AE0B4
MILSASDIEDDSRNFFLDRPENAARNVGGPLLNGGMNSIVAQLREIEENLDSAACDAFADEAIPELSAVEIADVLATTGRIQRRLEGVQIEATVQVRDRSEGMCDDKMTLAYGCSRPADLVRMLIGSDSRQATQLVKAAGHVRRDRSFTEGSFLPRAIRLCATLWSAANSVLPVWSRRPIRSSAPRDASPQTRASKRTGSSRTSPAEWRLTLCPRLRLARCRFRKTFACSRR